MILRPLSAIRRLRRSEDGGLTVEACVILPLLVWVYTAMFVFWDAYKTENTALKAAYTVADMISREVLPIDANYIDGANTLFTFLSHSDDTTNLRVTVVEAVDDGSGNPDLNLVWSHSTSNSWSNGSSSIGPHTNTDLLESKIPILAIGDQLIVVETFANWSPVFEIGLPEKDLYSFVVAKPRYAGQVLWDNGAGT